MDGLGTIAAPAVMSLCSTATMTVVLPRTALKTPGRAMLSSLVDISSGNQLHCLSRRKLAVYDLVLPQCPATAHARQTNDSDVVFDREASRIAVVCRPYGNMDFRKVEQITPLLSGAALDKLKFPQQLARSIKFVLADVLFLCDERFGDGIASDIWIDDGDRSSRSAISRLLSPTNPPPLIERVCSTSFVRR